MADPTGEQLRRQGMADAVVAIVLSRRLAKVPAEEIGSWIGLRQREVLDAIDRMKAGDQLVRRALADDRTPAAIKAEIEERQAEIGRLKAEHKAAVVAARRQEREARAARALRAVNPSKKTPEQRAARIAQTGGAPCPTCGHVCEDRRGLAMHLRTHETGVCDRCGGTFVLIGLGPHRRHCKGGQPDAA